MNKGHLTGCIYWLLIASSWTWCGSSCDITDLLNKGGRVDILYGRNDVQSVDKDTFRVWIKDAPPPLLLLLLLHLIQVTISIFYIWMRKPGDKTKSKRIGKGSLLLLTSLSAIMTTCSLRAAALMPSWLNLSVLQQSSPLLNINYSIKPALLSALPSS